MSTYWISLELRVLQVVVTAGANRRAKLQFNHHHQQTNTQLLLIAERRMYHCSPGRLPTLSLTTKGSWLPWGRVAKPLVSPLTPTPIVSAMTEVYKALLVHKHILKLNININSWPIACAVNSQHLRN